MTEPKKPASPASSSATAPAQAANAAQSAPAKKTGEELWKPLDNPELAKRSADQEINHMAQRAIEWKRTKGVYPWEEPESARDKQVGKQQSEWLRSVGVDPDKSANDFLAKVQDAVRRIEAQKKTDPGRGGR